MEIPGWLCGPKRAQGSGNHRADVSCAEAQRSQRKFCEYGFLCYRPNLQSFVGLRVSAVERSKPQLEIGFCRITDIGAVGKWEGLGLVARPAGMVNPAEVRSSRGDSFSWSRLALGLRPHVPPGPAGKTGEGKPLQRVPVWPTASPRSTGYGGFRKRAALFTARRSICRTFPLLRI